MRIAILTYPVLSHNILISSLANILKHQGIDVYCFIDQKHKHLYNEELNFIYYQYDAITESNSLFDEHIEAYPEFPELIQKIKNYAEYLDFHENIMKINCFLNKKIKNSISNQIKEIAPHIILRDTCALWGKMIAEEQSIKIVAYICNLIITKEYILSDINQNFYNGFFNVIHMDSERVKGLIDSTNDINKDIYEKYLIPYQYNMNPDEELNLIFGSKELQPPYYYAEQKKVIFVKPPLFEKDYINQKKEKLIYVSTGSMIGAELDFYNETIKAFKNTEYNVLISFPYADSKELKFNLPSNITIEKYVNQKEILQKATLFISHGGYNSIYESIYYQVPLMVYPLVNDQFFNADIIENLGIGINFRRHKFNHINIKYLADQLIDNEIAKSNLKYLSEDFKKSSSVFEVATFIKNEYAL